MAMKLPFLKHRFPRIAVDGPDDKLVQGSASDHLQDHVSGELFDAVKNKDIKAFRAAIEALLMDMFDWGDNG